MANDKDFIVKNAVEVGGSMKTTIGTVTNDDIDLSTGNYFSDTLAADATYTISNAGDVQSFQIEVTGSSVGYSLADTVYDSVSFSVTSQEANVRGLNFSYDGTKMYVIGRANDTIYQYTLSTAWDLSTASYASKSFSVSSQDGTPEGLYFKSDGTKFYMIGGSNDTVHQYTMSTAWDISTASYDSVSFSISSEETAPSAIFFKSDGTKMYITGTVNDTVREYSLSTAWNVSTASYTTGFSIATQSPSSSGMHFRDDGLGFFIIDSVNDAIYQYSLTTAWDVSTSSYDSISFDASVNSSAFHSIFFKGDGTKMYTLANGNDTVLQYTSTGPASITWPSSIEWAGGAAPPAPATGEKDIFTISTDDGGTTYNGLKTGDNFS